MGFKIGNVEIKNKVILAPMAGVCNSAFRSICKEMGASLVCCEMVSANGMIYNSKKTKDMLYYTDEERPISQQIFGSDKDTFVKAAKMVYEEMHPDIIDINMGCPVPKVAVRSQAGASLLKNPDLIYEIVSAVVSAVPIPVTVKIRSGWDSKSINAVEVAKKCEAAGASAITVHGRTRSELYSGACNLDIIKAVKENVHIPVIGNGDVNSGESAKRMLDYTGCDAVMIGRAALGNPWIFKEINAYLAGQTIDKPTYHERIMMCYKHLEKLMQQKPERVSVLEMRSHIAWYIKGIPYHKEIKELIFKAKTQKEITEILESYEKKLYNEIEV